MTSWSGSDDASRSPNPRCGGALEHQPHLGLGHRKALTRTDEERHSRPAPVLDVQSQRCVRLGGRVGVDTVDRPVPLVLAAHVVRRICGDDRLEHRALRVLQRLRVSPGRRFHRRGGDDLHEVVHHHIAERADRIVEVAAVLDAEVLRHRDLHALDVVTVPHGLEHGVPEAEIEDLLESHLPEVVVDAQEL